MDNYQKLVTILGFNRVKLDEPLAEYTYMKVGGPAELLYISANKEELARAVKTSRELGIPFTIIGSGANILVSDKGIKGLVLINQSKKIKFLANGFLEAESGVNCALLLKETTDRQLSGIERMMKVPSTVGGAVFMNAGHTARSEFFDDLVVSVEVINERNEVKKIMKKDAEFGYRSSRFQKSGEIILSAMLHLEKVDKKVIEQKIRDLLVIKQNQPAGPSVGSTFRNPEGGFAGKMIEEVGLKGTTHGGAKISELHANFIINMGNATADDVKYLIDLMKELVKTKLGVTLEEEVRYVGEW